MKRGRIRTVGRDSVTGGQTPSYQRFGAALTCDYGGWKGRDACGALSPSPPTAPPDMKPSEKFRGMTVSWSARYPRVYLPQHPAAMADGMVYIHRLIAWEQAGGIPAGHQVHHKDGDPQNFDPGNLEILLPDEHYRRHRPLAPPMNRECGQCGGPVEARTRRRKERDTVYCSPRCFWSSNEVADWPSDEELIEMVERLGAREVGRQLGVSDTAVRKRLRRLGEGGQELGDS